MGDHGRGEDEEIRRQRQKKAERAERKKAKKAASTKSYSDEHKLKDLFASLFLHIKTDRPPNVKRYAVSFFERASLEAGEATATYQRSISRDIPRSKDPSGETATLMRQATINLDPAQAIKKKKKPTTPQPSAPPAPNQGLAPPAPKKTRSFFEQVTGTSAGDLLKREDTLMNLPAPSKPVKRRGGGRQARKADNRRRSTATKDDDARAVELTDTGTKPQMLQPNAGARGHGRGGGDNQGSFMMRMGQQAQGSFRQVGEAAMNTIGLAQQSFMFAARQTNKLHNHTFVDNARRRQAAMQDKIRAAYREKYGDHGTEVMKQMENIKEHPAVFTLIVSVAMVGVFLHSILTNEVADWGLGFEMETLNFDYFNGIRTEDQQIPKLKNMWYGPHSGTLIAYGAKYSPCMRKEEALLNKTLLAAETEMDYGCCYNASKHAMQTTRSNCLENLSQNRTSAASSFTYWYSGLCTEEHTVVARPCCYGILNECVIIPEPFCDALSGVGYSKYHDDAQRCSHVNCFEGLCGMESLGANLRIGGAAEEVLIGYDAEGEETFFEWDIPNQFWRFFSPIFMHVGVGHLLFNLSYQVKGVAEIENLAGFRNTALMFLLSGFGGNAFAAFMEPESVSAGASSSLYGIIGVQTVDLFQSWQIVENRWRSLFFTFLQLVVLLGIGTLPQVDNFAHAGGFVVGVVTGIAFLPYVHFSSVDRIRKWILKNVAKLVIGIGTMVTVVLFYSISDPNFCTWCKYINCVPYTEGLCDVNSQADVEGS